MKRILTVIGPLLFLTFSLAFGQIDSQWRGPNREGAYPEKNLLNKWPDRGAKLLWFAEGLGRALGSSRHYRRAIVCPARGCFDGLSNRKVNE